MRATKEEVKHMILVDYSVGLKQDELAKKYGVSLGMVNKLVKGKERTNAPVVKQLTDIACHLSGQDETVINAVEREVLNRVKDIEYFRAASLKIINRALQRVDDPAITMFELEKAQNIIGKGRENIYGKQAETQVNVQNNQNNEIKFKWED
jgi:predicted transcriptional regulator